MRLRTMKLWLTRSSQRRRCWRVRGSWSLPSEAAIPAMVSRSQDGSAMLGLWQPIVVGAERGTLGILSALCRMVDIWYNQKTDQRSYP